MKEDIYLSQYFQLEEFTRSETAERLGIDNSIKTNQSHSSLGGRWLSQLSIINSLCALCEAILEPLRGAYGKAIHISSGYRCLQLNRAIGSKDTSQHIKGEACDISQGLRSENLKLFRLIQDLGLPFDQLIWEGGGRWIHVSHKANGHNRGQILYLFSIINYQLL